MRKKKRLKNTTIAVPSCTISILSVFSKAAFALGYSLHWQGYYDQIRAEAFASALIDVYYLIFIMPLYSSSLMNRPPCTVRFWKPFTIISVWRSQ